MERPKQGLIKGEGREEIRECSLSKEMQGRLKEGKKWEMRKILERKR